MKVFGLFSKLDQCIQAHDHRKLTFPYQGLDQKLTGVEESRVVSEIIA